MLWFAVYLGVQSIVSTVVVFFLAFSVLQRFGVDFALDPMWVDLLLEEVLQYSNLLTVLCNGVFLLVLVLFFVLRRKNLLQQLQLRPCKPMVWPMAALYGFGVCFVTGFLINLIPFPEELLESFDESYALLDMGSPIIGILASVIMAPIAEEVVFRGLFHGQLRKGMPVWAAMLISSAFFGMMHGEWIWMLHAFMAGMALAWIYERTQSLWPCILVHFVNNLISEIETWVGYGAPWVEWLLIGLSFVSLAGTVLYFVFRRQPEPVEEPALTVPAAPMPMAEEAAPVMLLEAGSVPVEEPPVSRPMADDIPQKSVLLLGDSIRLGYAPIVRQRLEGIAQVISPEDNCRHTQYTFINLAAWQQLVPDPRQVAVVYWNNGQWDAAHWDGDPLPLNPIRTYCDMLVRIARKLRKQYPYAEIVFATTTSVDPMMDPRAAEEIRAYNSAAVDTMRQYGIRVDDLHGVLDQAGPMFRDYCHLTSDGYQLLGNHVADCIRWML